MSFYMDSFVGNVRENNEDSYYFERFDDFFLMVLADGMGGHRNGELASSYAVNIVVEFVKRNIHLYKNFSTLLVDAFCKANSFIFEKNCSYSNGDTKNVMGTTLEVVLIHNSNMFCAHIGDSRVYSKFEDEFIQLTTDHSYAQFLLSKGAITEYEFENYAVKNKLLRAVGTDKDIDVDVFSRGLRIGEKILVCSDGLTNELSTSVINLTMSKNVSAMLIVEELINLVKNTTPASDNVTVGVYKIEV